MKYLKSRQEMHAIIFILLYNQEQMRETLDCEQSYFFPQIMHPKWC